MIDNIVFWILAVVAATGAVAVIALKNTINSVMALLVTMIAAAGIYALIGAYVLALFQVIIYIGAVLVLFVFVVMLLDLKSIPVRRGRPGFGAVIAAAFGVVLTAGTVGLIWTVVSATNVLSDKMGPAGTLRPGQSLAAIALELFGRHMLVFELTSILLFAAAVGAVFISRKEKNPS